MNQHPLVRTEFHPPEYVIICDETLREGEETPGVYLSDEGRLEIARKLEEVNIPEIEVGYVGAIPEHTRFSEMLKREGTECRLVSHTRTYTRGAEWRDEVKRAVDAGSDVLCLLSHGSETLAATMPWLPLAEIPDRVAEAVEYTATLGATPALALVDGVRTPLENFRRIHRAAASAGVKRVYVMDGQGVALPETIYFLVRELQGIVGSDVEIAVHCHDDYGLATANTLAGVKAGAEVVDTVVGGLGDKAGIGATEEVVMGLEVLYGVSTRVQIEKLHELAQTVARVFGLQLAPNKAVVGENIARHQIDSHLNTLIRGYWWAWESMKPELFDRERSLEWARGKLRTGRSGSVGAKLEEMGFELTDREWDRLLNQIREEVEKNNMLDEQHIENLILEVSQDRGTA
jgi:methanogen homocitrate synthase